MSRLNAKSNCFVSWHLEPGATAVDVFSIYWANLKCYVFPPFSRLTQVLAKIRSDKALVLFIASVWTTQNCFGCFCNFWQITQSYCLERTTLLHCLSVKSFIPWNTAYSHPHGGYPETTCRQRLFWRGKQDHQCLMALWDWSTVQFSFEEMVLLVWAKERVDFLQAHVNEVVNFLSQCYSESKSYSTVITYR